MSLVDEARTVRQRIAARLRELEPLVREYEELKQAAAEMGIGQAAADGRAAPKRQSRTRARNEKQPVPADEDHPAGDLSDRVLTAVRSEPGKAVADYARMLELPPPALYRPVRELANAGAIVKRARQLFPS
jgi:hypothetical protein